MWIRSQDKKKIGDYKYLFILDNEIRAESCSDVDVLGKYETPERTIEVLNEIEKYIKSDYENLQEALGRIILKNGVYYMPEE